MEVINNGRLPGIYFQAEVPVPRAALPRMDIAAFVGFASCGPLGTPVPVEDVARFRSIFGEDLPLAWEAASGRATYAHLAPSVEAFFREGGRRCWVVRVAQDPAVNIFPVPGLVEAASGVPALARSRCGGSWSDALRIGTVLSSRALHVDGLRFSGGAYEADLAVQAGDVLPGHLLRLLFDDDLTLFLPVQDVRLRRSGVQVRSTDGHWFRSRNPRLSQWAPAEVRLLTARGDRLPLFVGRVRQEEAGGFTVLLEAAPEDPLPVPGQVLELMVDPASGLPETRTLWLPVAAVQHEEVAGSLPGLRVHVQAPEGLWPVPANAQVRALLVQEAQASHMTARRLTFELLAWHGQEIRARLPGLGFGTGQVEQNETARDAASTRAQAVPWSRLPTDDRLFRLKDNQPDLPGAGTLEAELYKAPFPFAGPVQPAPLYLPLGMAAQPDFRAAQEQVLDASSRRAALERDGLADFTPALFLDPDLAAKKRDALLPAANDKRYLRGEALAGLHSLFPIDEVSLLAVPDAVHRGWEQGAPEPLNVLPAPEAFIRTVRDDLEAVVLAWSPVAALDEDMAVTYELQIATDAGFSQPVTRRIDEPEARHYFETDCPRRYFYRVRAVKGTQVSPWSVTRSGIVPKQDFEGCEGEMPAAPVLASFEVDGAPALRWDAVKGATAYRLEAAVDPAFLTATAVYDAAGAEELSVLEQDDARFFYHVLPPGHEGLSYYRVRAFRDGEGGAWSNTVLFNPAPGPVWTVLRPQAYDEVDDTGAGRRDILLAVHRAVLRLCAARGDLLALLSLPRHYREDEALAFVAALTPDPSDDADAGPGRPPVDAPPLLDMEEEQVLGFGALYHPWLAAGVQRQEEALAYMPPEGAVCGSIAARTLRLGAWVAPANEPLRGVLALDPDIGPAGWQRLLARHVNLVRPDARGFLLLSADTLSPSARVRPVNVRRLLILLRRLILREGDTYVFESNDDALRRRIYYAFDEVLAGLYRRGAFAGDTPGAAYRLVTDRSVNTQEVIDRGQLIVELQVAPSRPLSFLTVRLVQRGVEGFVIQEV